MVHFQQDNIQPSRISTMRYCKKEQWQWQTSKKWSSRLIKVAWQASKPYISHIFKDNNAHISAHEFYEMGSVMRRVPEGDGSNCH